jgi:tetratricopeptide (TPR) repeat protein
MELEALETSQAEPGGGKCHLFLGGYKFSTAVNGKVQPLFPQAQELLRGRNMTFIVNPFGLLWQRTVPNLPLGFARNFQLDYAELVNQIANTYEMTCLSLPNRQVQPRQNWQARVPVFLTNPLSVANQKKEFVDLIVTCTYEGRRVHGGESHAVISLSGTVNGRTPGPQSATGMVSGKVHFLIDKGYLSQGEMKVESESGDGDLTVSHSVEVSLRRQSGNTAGINRTPVIPAPVASVVKGSTIFEAVLTLAANDPTDCPQKPGCFYKLRQANFAAGKTYIIEMNKIGQSPLDPYLVLLNPAGQVVGADDDSGGFPNARIVHKAQQTGAFRIYATGLVPRMTGGFRLTVSEASSDMPVVAGPEHDLAVYYLQKKDFDRAIALFEKVVALDPKHVKAHADLGFAYNERKLYDKAIPWFKKVLELDPRHVTALNNLGVAYNEKRAYDQGIEYLEKAIKLDPNNRAAYSNLGFAYSQKRLHDEAIVCLKRAVELDPNNVFAHNSLGFSYNAKGLYDEAIPCARKAIELSPNHVIAHNNLGFAYNARGLYDEGIPWLKKAIRLQPKLFSAHDNLGFASAETGDLRGAREAYRNALALAPKGSQQFRASKSMLEQMDLFVSLEPRLAEIIKGELKPNGFVEGMRFGKLCRVKQHYQAAVRLYEQGLAGDPAAAKKLAPVNLAVFARTALLASLGAGTDPPPEVERPKYRAKALTWLRGYLKAQEETLAKNAHANRYSCQKDIRLLLQHKDFASVRPPVREDLPANERREWEDFWSQVDSFLQKAETAGLR